MADRQPPDLLLAGWPTAPYKAAAALLVGRAAQCIGRAFISLPRPPGWTPQGGAIRPSADIAGAPLINVTAGAPVPLNATNVTCANPPCSFYWTIHCDQLVNNVTATGQTTSVTTGAAGSDIPVPPGAVFNCSIDLLVVDCFASSPTPLPSSALQVTRCAGGARGLQVRRSPLAARSHAPRCGRKLAASKAAVWAGQIRFQIHHPHHPLPPAFLSRQITAPSGPTAAIDGAPTLSVTAGISAVLNASGSACTTANCSYSWTIDCRPAQAPFSKAGVVASVSTGFGVAVDVHMAASTGTNCTVALSVADSNGATGNATAVLQVRARAQFADAPCQQC